MQKALFACELKYFLLEKIEEKYKIIESYCPIAVLYSHDIAR